MWILRHFCLFTLIAATGCLVCLAQSADNSSSVVPKTGDSRDDYPKTFRETLEKLRIEKEKKEYQEMLDRGNEALKLTEELEKAVEVNGTLTEREHAKIANVEKLVKKIRGELGGNDEDDREKENGSIFARLSPVDAVKSLRSATVSLMDELKKTTRFSISAAAIQSTNAVLRVVKFLRFTK